MLLDYITSLDESLMVLLDALMNTKSMCFITVSKSIQSIGLELEEYIGEHHIRNYSFVFAYFVLFLCSLFMNLSSYSFNYNFLIYFSFLTKSWDVHYILVFSVIYLYYFSILVPLFDVVSQIRMKISVFTTFFWLRIHG